MKREEWKERLPLIQAFVEGETIQVYSEEDGWYDIKDVSFNFEKNEYRIKPEPKVIWVCDDNFVFYIEEYKEEYENCHGVVCRKYQEVIE